MNRILTRTLVIVGLVACLTSAEGATTDRQVFRDAQGRNMGSATTDRNGRTTFRDAQGRNMGSAMTDRNGRTTYRDAQGRKRGTRK